MKPVLSEFKNLIDNYRYTYIGSCADLYDEEYEVNSLFSDATDMAYYVERDDTLKDDEVRFIDVSKDEFLSYIKLSNIPDIALEGKDIEFCFILKHLCFFIYNLDQDMHYFFN